jgi:hypothetical protein
MATSTGRTNRSAENVEFALMALSRCACSPAGPTQTVSAIVSDPAVRATAVNRCIVLRVVVEV